MTLTGKEVELVEEIGTYKVDLLGVSEVRKKGSGEQKLESEYALIYAGVPQGTFAKEGVGIVMNPKMCSLLEARRLA